MKTSTHSKSILEHCQPSEYTLELLKYGVRQDLKPWNASQPDGPSLKVTDDSLVEWQKWRFRVGFNPGYWVNQVLTERLSGSCLLLVRVLADDWFGNRPIEIHEGILSRRVSSSLRIRRFMFLQVGTWHQSLWRKRVFVKARLCRRSCNERHWMTAYGFGFLFD